MTNLVNWTLTSEIIWLSMNVDLKFSVKLERESILKQLFSNMQYSTLIISTKFKILQFSNKVVVWALNSAKLIIIRAFLWRIYMLCWGYLVRPQLYKHNLHEVEIYQSKQILRLYYLPI